MAAPLVVSRTPGINEVNVYVNKYIEIVFDQALSPSTVNDNTIVVYRISDYNIIDKSVAYDNATFKVTVAPEIVFDQNTQYNVVVVGLDQSVQCVQNLAGQSLATSLTWYFTTGTEKGDQTGETHEEEIADTPSIDSPVSRVLEPKATDAL
ncbi:MAG: Ig-like domain-containing protein, partial [Candidatus Bathyarchaeota archaeon]|nr:Ig-like domain-containing protein [Candidatus Bathyarchaeota archaeon]